jgi:hypothetical protein
MRNITVVSKDFGGPEPARSWCCPACGATAQIQNAKTGEEDQREIDNLVIARVFKLLSLRNRIEPFFRPKSSELSKSWKPVHGG